MVGRKKAKPIAKPKRSITQNIAEIDKSNLKGDYDSWPDVSEDAWNNATVPQIGTDFQSILMAGMGGSGISGDLIADLANAQGSTLRFYSVKDYHLPKWADENTIVIGISSSGNTEETLSVLSEARRKGLQGFTFGSGGLIEDYSRTRWNYKFTKTKMLKVPRSSLPGIFFPLLKFFMTNSVLQFDNEDFRATFNALKVVRERCSDPNSASNPALELASVLVKSKGIPLVYSSVRTRAVGLRFRQSLNENAKMHAFNGEIPELCHNEVVGWDSDASLRVVSSKFEKPSDFVAVAIRLREDDPAEIRARFDVVKSAIERQGGQMLEAPYAGTTLSSRLLSMLYCLDYVTYYCSILRGVDPIRTPSIDYLKKDISRKLDYLKQI